jgi:hypothetical protein
MRRIVLISMACVSAMLALSPALAVGDRLPEVIFLADRQNSDVRVVMYMTPW